MPPDATGDYQKHWPCIVVVRMAGYRHFKLSVEETMHRNCQNIEIINDLFEIQLGNECNRGLSKALALHQFLTLALDALISLMRITNNFGTESYNAHKISKYSLYSSE